MRGISTPSTWPGKAQSDGWLQTERLRCSSSFGRGMWQGTMWTNGVVTENSTVWSTSGSSRGGACLELNGNHAADVVV